MKPSLLCTSFEGLPFMVSPQLPAVRLVANEGGTSAVEFNGWFEAAQRRAVVRLTFYGCVCARLLTVGGEARRGLGTVRNSRWLGEVARARARRGGDAAEDFLALKHFFVRGHDGSVEVIAQGFTWAAPMAEAPPS